MLGSSLSRSGRLIGVLLAAGSLSLAFVGTANAAPTGAPVSDDPRATAYAGNVTTCAEAKLPGEDITSELTATITTSTYITVTATAPGTTVSGIVVKGGPAYNIYLPAQLGMVPWKNLHSPLNPGKQVPVISHWFACGTTTTQTSSTSPSPSTPTSPTSATTGATTTSLAAGVPGGATTTVTTTPTSTPTTTPVAAATNKGTGNLAYTGFSGGWLIWLAAALLLGGGAVLATPKLRAAINRRR
ncbi:MAG TPA: hypothetical protein VG317_06490 [Pseudonocardiaceae bacterium]|nr:hypothetical protein [Pseudonocardiaceae bacterium]